MDKKNIYIALIIVIASIVIVGGCTLVGGDEYKLYNSRDKEEKNTASFNAAYFKDKERRHMAVFFDIVDGVLTPSSRPAEVRPGRMPHRSKTAGNVIIVYKGQDGKELGRYAIEDPILVRSCDFDKGKVGELKPINKGMVEILLPYNLMITTVEIERADGKRKAFDFSTQIEKTLKIKK
ncbi:MAG: hypothetical protein MUO24_01225 [Desulfobacterales bacterium]|nr:hypothetical protein [Desulfobacterales bacterium]